MSSVPPVHHTAPQPHPDHRQRPSISPPQPTMTPHHPPPYHHYPPPSYPPPPQEIEPSRSYGAESGSPHGPPPAPIPLMSIPPPPEATGGPYPAPAPPHYYPYHYPHYPPPPPYGYPVYYHPHHQPPYHYGVPNVSGDMSINEDQSSKKDVDMSRANSFRSAASEETTDELHPMKRDKQGEFKLLIKKIEEKNEEEKTEEEARLYATFQQRRRRKNERSRERTRENKAEMSRVMAKPVHERTEDEKKWLAIRLKAKYRKNQKDRERRKRLKMMGSSISSTRSLSPSRYSPYEISHSNTYTSQESNGDSLIHADSFNTTSDLPTTIRIPEQEEEDLCPKMFLQLAKVIKSPDSPASRQVDPPLPSLDLNRPLSNNFSGEYFDGVSQQSTSPIRIPMRSTSSRSSIFRLKPNEQPKSK